MVKVKEDITGWKMWEHGVPDSKIIVLKQVEDYVKPDGRHESKWLCECNCDKHTRLEIIGSNIKTGKTKSCGCAKSDGHRKYNKYDLSGEYGVGWTSNTNKEFYFDLEDYDKIKNYCWMEDVSTGYIKTRISKDKCIYLHRAITNNEYNIVDHKNRNKFDNRKMNLRNATKQINTLNRDGAIITNMSGFTGVRFNEEKHKWHVQICVNNQNIYLGLFANKEDAIRERLKAEKKYFGEFAPQRHLFEEYGIEDEFLTTQN